MSNATLSTRYEGGSGTSDGTSLEAAESCRESFPMKIVIEFAAETCRVARLLEYQGVSERL